MQRWWHALAFVPWEQGFGPLVLGQIWRLPLSPSSKPSKWASFLEAGGGVSVQCPPSAGAGSLSSSVSLGYSPGTNLTRERRGGGARAEGTVRRREERGKMAPGLGQGRAGFVVAPASLPFAELGSTPAVPNVCVKSDACPSSRS